MLEHRWRIREQGLNLIPFRQGMGNDIYIDVLLPLLRGLPLPDLK